MHSDLNLPILLKCENISPPGTNSITMYRLELSWGGREGGREGAGRTARRRYMAMATEGTERSQRWLETPVDSSAAERVAYITPC